MRLRVGLHAEVDAVRFDEKPDRIAPEILLLLAPVWPRFWPRRTKSEKKILFEARKGDARTLITAPYPFCDSSTPSPAQPQLATGLGPKIAQTMVLGITKLTTRVTAKDAFPD